MNTLTERIAHELLDSLNDTDGLQDVMERHRGSKGPYYAGLGRATAVVEDWMTELRDDLRSLTRERDEKRAEAEAAEAGLADLLSRQREAEERVKALEATEEALRPVVEKVGRLKDRGFGEAELERLHDLLSRLAAERGVQLQEGVGQFFEIVDRFTSTASLDLEATRAETRVEQARAEKDRWEAEARRSQARSRARVQAIDLFENLMDQGVKPGDLALWTEILDKSGADVDSLTRQLKDYGSIDALCKQRRSQSGKLRDQVRKREARLKALVAKQGEIEEGIAALRDGGLEAMEEVSLEVRSQLEGIATKLQEYGALRRDAEILKDDLAVARVLKSRNPENWKLLPRETIIQLLYVPIAWSSGPGRNRLVAPPEAVHRKYPGLTSFTLVNLTDLLVWVVMGLMTDEERRTAAAM